MSKGDMITEDAGAAGYTEKNRPGTAGGDRREDDTMRQIISYLRGKAWLRPILFTAAGTAAGALYYTFFGCTSGCAITSSPYLSAVYGALLGWLLSGATGKER